MNLKRQVQRRKLNNWPILGIGLGAVVGVIPSTGVTLGFGIVAWFIDTVCILVMARTSVGARIGVLMAGLFLAIPCHVRATPLARGTLMCVMGLPFAAAVGLMLAPPTDSFRERLVYLYTWCGTHQVKRQPSRFDVTALLRFIVATMLFASAFVIVNAAGDSGRGLLMRWFGGGVAFFAGAEMITACHDLVTALVGTTAPSLFRSPHLSVTLSEFWTRRWNVAASEMFRRFCFAPLARHGAAWGLWAAFTVSAIAHVLLAFMALGRLRISLICGAFFMVQPLLIAMERGMNVRRWPRAAGRAWTFVALTITCPLMVEPALQIIEGGSERPINILSAILWILGFAIGLSGVASLASLASGPGSAKVRAI